MRALFLPTCVAGVNFWRMVNPANAALRNKLFHAHVLWWQKGNTEMHPWQMDIMMEAHRSRITGELDTMTRGADVVVMGMVHIPSGYHTFAGLRECYGKPVVMEIDDNVLSCPVYNPAAGSYAPGTDTRALTVKQMRESDALFVTTPYLKEIYSEFNANIYVLPNAIDFDMWGKTQRRKNKGKITLGWVGGANHNDDLLILENAVDTLTAKYPEVEFVFGHGMHPKFRGKKGVRWVQEFFRIDKYPKGVARMGFDIGMAPLVDNAFNRGKSNLRWLEYSALGIPTVASRVGHFAETIEDGKTGLLCDTPEDFTTNLERLIKDVKLRKELARNAKAEVYEKFNIDNVAKQYKAALIDIEKRGQVAHTTTIEKESNYKPIVEAA